MVSLGVGNVAVAPAAGVAALMLLRQAVAVVAGRGFWLAGFLVTASTRPILRHLVPRKGLCFRDRNFPTAHNTPPL